MRDEDVAGSEKSGCTELIIVSEIKQQRALGPANFHIHTGIPEDIVDEVAGKGRIHQIVERHNLTAFSSRCNSSAAVAFSLGPHDSIMSAVLTARYITMTSTAWATIVIKRLPVRSRIIPQIRPSQRAIQWSPLKVLTMNGSNVNASALRASATGERRRSGTDVQNVDSRAARRPKTKPRKFSSTKTAIPQMNQGT